MLRESTDVVEMLRRRDYCITERRAGRLGWSRRRFAVHKNCVILVIVSSDFPITLRTQYRFNTHVRQHNNVQFTSIHTWLQNV